MLRPLLTAAALFLTALTAQAADISWSLGPNFGGPLGHQGILTNGALVAAVDLRSPGGGAPEVVDPSGLNISFTPLKSPLFNTFYNDPANGIGDPVWSSIIANFLWNSGANVSAPTFLTDLTTGDSYQVQLFSGRSYCCVGTRTLSFGDGNGHASTPISMAANSFVSVVGTFVADGSTQWIQLNDSSSNPALSAYVLRDLSTVPEPTSAVLLLGGLLGLGGRMRRRR